MTPAQLQSAGWIRRRGYVDGFQATFWLRGAYTIKAWQTDRNVWHIRLERSGKEQFTYSTTNTTLEKQLSDVGTGNMVLAVDTECERWIGRPRHCAPDSKAVFFGVWALTKINPDW